MKFCKNHIFKQNSNIPENFVKLYSVFQKLDHLTSSKLNLSRHDLKIACAKFQGK